MYTSRMTPDFPLTLIDRARIASPCPARWDDMTLTGDDHVRHCGRCDLKVHNLSGMRRDEAEAVLASYFAPGGSRQRQRLCAQWRRRPDGTMIFGDCPVGLAKLRRKVWRTVARAAAVAGFTSLLAACTGGGGDSSGDGRFVGVVDSSDDGRLGGSVAVPDDHHEDPGAGANNDVQPPPKSR
jgi:hypothetical protein